MLRARLAALSASISALSSARSLASRMMSGAGWICGFVVSVTTTWNEPSASLPAASLAAQFTVVSPIGNVLSTPAEELYFRADNLAHREHVKNTVCPTCLSPCQVNVGAMKQFVPYAKFLVRASQVKRDPARHLETLPTHQA